MSTKVMYTSTEDKQEMQKQLGCMNGIFQLFDRRYLLGQRRNGHHQKKPPQGQNDNGKEINNASEKPKEKMAKDNHRVSVESSRNSYSSSCSSLECSKRVQTEQSSFCPSVFSEPSSPTSHTKTDFSTQPSDIKNVVKDSMTRKPRVVPVKTVSKDERKGPAMTHVDSPRPLEPHPKPGPYERKDQNLAKLREISNSRGVKEVKETSRFSYDGRVSQYKLKSFSNIKELPRLSLDSKQSSIKNLTNVNEETQSHESGSNKRPPSSVVARLMGLEVLKNEPVDESNSLARKPVSPKAPNVSTRIPLEPAPWKQEVKKTDRGCKSVYGQIERRLTEVEFKTSGKDLRALKQILEAIQRTKMKLEMTDDSKSVQPVSSIIKGTAIKPTPESLVIKNLQKVKKVNPGKKSARNVASTETNATNRNRKPVSPSRAPEYLAQENYCSSRNSPTVSPRLQRSNKQNIHVIRKQQNSKSKSINPVQTNDQSCRNSCHIRNLSQQSDTISFPSESDASVGSQNEPEVSSTDWTQENKNKFAEKLPGYKPMTELAIPTLEQPSPVSVLDAFCTEETLSPIRKRSYAFNDDEDLCIEEREWSQVGIDSLVSSRKPNQPTSEFNQIKLDNIRHLVHQIELLNSTDDEATINPLEGINGDHTYIKEILLASGLLKNLDCVIQIIHLHPTGSLINPELFNMLEKTKECTSKSEKIRRKMIFDTVNYMLVQKLTRAASSGQWTSKRKARTLNAEKFLEELCLEINNLETKTVCGQYYDIINIITEDMSNKSEDWEDNCSEVPALALDIERLIFKDLISEIVNAKVAGRQDGHGRHRRQLSFM
uniref:protein LONGIFOLIA 1-like n=1 Tax=Erigeron canadensis TaxID=72917 RepID=UPI001CB907A0|nr:protein LONGIFOLIA 1-like [Erigeron canadensis]